MIGQLDFRISPRLRGWIWVSTALVSFILLGLLSSLYGERVSSDTVRRVTITGNRILSTDRLEGLLTPLMGQRLEAVNPDSVQAAFLRHPLVKAAKVSRHYPDELRIQIQEVYPIAYLQGQTYFSIALDGRILPLPDYGMIYSLPIITGITDVNTIKPGTTTQDDYVRELLTFLTGLRFNNLRLYRDISEIQYTTEKGMKLITSTNSTPVYMGNYDQVWRNCAILQAFIRQLDAGPVLPAYRYVDLRFKNQVVVRERR